MILKLFLKDYWFHQIDMPGEYLVVFVRDGDKIANFSIPTKFLEDYDIKEDADDGRQPVQD